MPMPEGDAVGIDMLMQMRQGGLMTAISASHLLIALMLALPRLRFAGALLQLPMSIGILAFHVYLLPEGTGVAIGLLVLNLIVLADPRQITRLVSPPT